MIARIFIVVYNGIFIYIVKRGVSQPLMYGSLLVHGSRWSAPLDNHVKKSETIIFDTFRSKFQIQIFFFHSCIKDLLRFKSRICLSVHLLVSCSNFRANRPIVSKFGIFLWRFSVYLHWIHLNLCHVSSKIYSYGSFLYYWNKPKD